MPTLCVESPPPSLLRAVERVAAARFGRGELRGEALARAVQRVSAAYTRRDGSPDALRGDAESLCARLKFFLPRDWPKISAPLAELAAVGALPQRSPLRILDLGAGLGATSLAAAHYCLRRAGATRVTIDAVDRDAAGLELGRELAREFATQEGLALELTPHALSLEAALARGVRPPYQLIVLGFVLNELAPLGDDSSAAHAELLEKLAPLLDPDGALVVLEPALRATSRNLQRVRAQLLAAHGPLHVFAPCLHAGPCPLLARERDWGHAELPLELPEPIAAIARAAELRTSDLTYSYLTLVRTPRSLAELSPGRPLLRAVSSLLPSKGKLELAVCGPDAPDKLRRLSRHASAANEAFEQVRRGSILRLSPAAPSTPLHDLRAEDSVETVLSVAADEG